MTIPDAELIRFEFGSGTELERAAVANVVVDILLKELDQRENMARARLIADNEKARFDIRVKRVDFSRAEQELKNRIGSEQGEDVSAGLAFPLGL
ncbi:MAG: hypothetical protein NT069_34655, partial [Planctomycetota bacterium]|nr:hypothetical protein [Planctomycetota bacterium]